MRVLVLGRVGIVAGGVRHEIGRAQTRATLGLLALNLGQPVSVDGVTRALWGGAEPSTARAQIHNAISAVRRTFAELGARDVIVGGRHGYELALPPDQVDLGEFREVVRQARRVGRDDPAGAVRSLRQALQLWQGEPLADAAAAFVDAARAQLEEQRLAVVEELADLEIALGQPAEAVRGLLPLVDAYPLRETLRRRLMVALDHSGRPAEALETYRTYRELLAGREGLDPGPEISRLETEILRRGPGHRP